MHYDGSEDDFACHMNKAGVSPYVNYIVCKKASCLIYQKVKT